VTPSDEGVSGGAEEKKCRWEGKARRKHAKDGRETYV
jgi:hypothetical protein